MCHSGRTTMQQRFHPGITIHGNNKLLTLQTRARWWSYPSKMVSRQEGDPAYNVAQLRQKNPSSVETRPEPEL